MILVQENYKLVNDLLSKNNGVYLSPAEYNRYAELASNDYFDVSIGSKNAKRSVYGINRTLDRRLQSFRVVDPIPVINGVAEIPEDAELITAIYTSDYIPLRTVDEDRLARLMQDPLADPTVEDPAYKEDKDSIRVYPSDINSVTFEYLKRPVAPKYGYTVVNNRAVYSESDSVNFDWNKREEAELTMRILQYCGVSMGSAEIYNVATQAKQEE